MTDHRHRYSRNLAGDLSRIRKSITKQPNSTRQHLQGKFYAGDQADRARRAEGADWPQEPPRRRLDLLRLATWIGVGVVGVLFWAAVLWIVGVLFWGAVIWWLVS